MPERIQLRRTKGWRKPDGAIVVARPSRWGNPFIVGEEVDIGHAGYQGWSVGWAGDPDEQEAYFDLHETVKITPEIAVKLYRVDLLLGLMKYPKDHPEDRKRRDALEVALSQLRGHDLACWCPGDQACHADVLLEMANG